MSVASTHGSQEPTSVCPPQKSLSVCLSAGKKPGFCFNSAASCPPAAFSAAFLISAEAIPTILSHPLRFSLSVVDAIVLRSSGTSREQIFLSFPQKRLLAASPLRLRDGRFRQSVFFLFRLFYPSFLLAVGAERPGSGWNECLQKTDGLIPSSWTNA